MDFVRHLKSAKKKKQQLYLLLFHPFITPSFISYIPKRYITTRITIIHSIEFSAPHLDDMGQSLKQDGFDAFIQFSYPIIEIGITFQIQTINLIKKKKISPSL